MPLLGNPHCFKSFISRFSAVCAFFAMVIVGFVVVLSQFSSLAFAGEVSGDGAVERVGIEVSGVKAGQAFVTRFSGVETRIDGDGKSISVLNLNGVVGRLIDITRPLGQPVGQHWKNPPQALEILASETGQVFGIAFDDAMPPNIYVSATSAFGLHRSPNNQTWAQGMWGKGLLGKEGGPGTIYKLNAQNNYAPEIFADVRLQGRENSGPALGNLAYDKVNKQLFVSDLETGMIHRFDIKSGEDLGHYDHGVTGRSRFFDALTGKISNLKTHGFKADCVAQVKMCKSDFSSTPSCWNYAPGDRRVWGLGVRTMADGKQRLFYATWGSVDSDEGVNAVWSIELDENGGFAIDKITREFVIEPLMVDGKIAFSAPTDLAFSSNGDLLVAERAAPRNYLGTYYSPFARPTISRSFEYRLGLDGRWVSVGQYDIGNRPANGRPANGRPANGRSAGEVEKRRFDNGAGGVAWGYGYDKFGRIDLTAKNQFVWLSGDSLCSKMGKCFDPLMQAYSDPSHVVGIEGRKRGFWRGNIDKSFKIDNDHNVLKNGAVDLNSLARNDDSQGAGDVEIYQAPQVVDRAVVKEVAPRLTEKITVPVFKNPDSWTENPVQAQTFDLVEPNAIDREIATPNFVAQTIIVLPREKPVKKVNTKKVNTKKVIRAKKAAKSSRVKSRKVAERKIKSDKKAKRTRLKRKISEVKKRKTRHKTRHKTRYKTQRKKQVRKIPRKVFTTSKAKCGCQCACKCKCAPKPKTQKPLKRVLHPAGKADYSGAKKVKVFAPSRP